MLVSIHIVTVTCEMTNNRLDVGFRRDSHYGSRVRGVELAPSRNRGDVVRDDGAGGQLALKIAVDRRRVLRPGVRVRLRLRVSASQAEAGQQAKETGRRSHPELE